jgi:hypothetical protein
MPKQVSNKNLDYAPIAGSLCPGYPGHDVFDPSLMTLNIAEINSKSVAGEQKIVFLYNGQPMIFCLLSDEKTGQFFAPYGLSRRAPDALKPNVYTYTMGIRLFTPGNKDEMPLRWAQTIQMLDAIRQRYVELLFAERKRVNISVGRSAPTFDTFDSAIFFIYDMPKLPGSDEVDTSRKTLYVKAPYYDPKAKEIQQELIGKSAEEQEKLLSKVVGGTYYDASSVTKISLGSKKCRYQPKRVTPIDWALNVMLPDSMVIELMAFSLGAIISNKKSYFTRKLKNVYYKPDNRDLCAQDFICDDSDDSDEEEVTLPEFVERGPTKRLADCDTDLEGGKKARIAECDTDLEGGKKVRIESDE